MTTQTQPPTSPESRPAGRRGPCYRERPTMRQIQIRKRTTRTALRELDLRTPSGRVLPF